MEPYDNPFWEKSNPAERERENNAVNSGHFVSVTAHTTTRTKISKPYDNSFWEKSNPRRRRKKEKNAVNRDSALKPLGPIYKLFWSKTSLSVLYSVDHPNYFSFCPKKGSSFQKVGPEPR